MIRNTVSYVLVDEDFKARIIRKCNWSREEAAKLQGKGVYKEHAGKQYINILDVPFSDLESLYP